MNAATWFDREIAAARATQAERTRRLTLDALWAERARACERQDWDAEELYGRQIRLLEGGAR